MDTLKDVRLFHETFGHPIEDEPKLITKERLITRIQWIESELQELIDALNNGDIIECADALADAQYFLSGTIIEFGLAKLFPAIFAEVQRSNMSKSCSTHEEAYDTMIKYSKEGIPTHINDNLNNGLYTVIRAIDGKTLKSINWSSPDLSFIK